ncbi:MAG: hypothetical protein UZ13_00138 [Chloroflexi bacterium OLB13]|nr:MAG: hypothetical protein UZ13_00138 [Chloroflexi bacterium OLB13]
MGEAAVEVKTLAIWLGQHHRAAPGPARNQLLGDEAREGHADSLPADAVQLGQLDLRGQQVVRREHP